MRTSGILVALALGSAPRVASAQSLAFDDDFRCSDASAFGAPPGVNGWQSLLAADAWSTDLHTGVAPLTDNGAGTFGSPIDDYENFLVTGHPSWTDVELTAQLFNTVDNDGMGVVARYASPDSYYACYLTNDSAPDCNGNGGGAVVDQVRLVRVDTSAACVSDYIVASANFTYLTTRPYRVRLSAVGDQIGCAVEVVVDGDVGGPGDIVLAYTDPDPLPGGLAGLSSFNNGNGDGTMIYDNVEVWTWDEDLDADGLVAAAEAELGTSDESVDTDGDTISDRHEASMAAFTYDGDADGVIDALDTDSDGDGVSDADEAGDADLGTPPVDSDCDGEVDAVDVDSDGDFVLDDVDNCRTTANPSQLDSDADGAGDLCDATALPAGASLYLFDDFRCNDEESFGEPASEFGWDATLDAGDPWSTAFNGGVSPVTDDGFGDFGAPLDDYENALLTGSDLWDDVVVNATLVSSDDDGIGLAARVSGPGSYYACFLTNDQSPDCAGDGATRADGIYLRRVDTSVACVDDYDVDEVAFTYAAGVAYRMRLAAVGDTVTCAVDTDLNGIVGDAGDLVLSYVDPVPLPPGPVALWSYQNGDAVGDAIFDAVSVVGSDPDGDLDGVPDAVEALLGTDPTLVDSDGDTISDRHELLDQGNPVDSDADGMLDALDTDSDGDGLPDAAEAGDADVGTRPADQDCDGYADYRDDDADADGTTDDLDLCPTVVDRLQGDRDGDGIGDLCDPQGLPATVPGDTGDTGLTTPTDTGDTGLTTTPTTPTTTPPDTDDTGLTTTPTTPPDTGVTTTPTTGTGTTPTTGTGSTTDTGSTAPTDTGEPTEPTTDTGPTTDTEPTTATGPTTDTEPTVPAFPDLPEEDFTLRGGSGCQCDVSGSPGPSLALLGPLLLLLLGRRRRG